MPFQVFAQVLGKLAFITADDKHIKGEIPKWRSCTFYTAIVNNMHFEFLFWRHLSVISMAWLNDERTRNKAWVFRKAFT